jgi:hypothetical protein
MLEVTLGRGGWRRILPAGLLSFYIPSLAMLGFRHRRVRIQGKMRRVDRDVGHGYQPSLNYRGISLKQNLDF